VATAVTQPMPAVLGMGVLAANQTSASRTTRLKYQTYQAKQELRNSVQLATKRTDMHQKEMHDIKLQNNDKLLHCHTEPFQSKSYSNPLHFLSYTGSEPQNQIAKHHVSNPFPK
jgi:hypothetical protein